jgi:cytidine deaminase
MKLTDQQLGQMAMDVAKQSYSPYSHFSVGAALVADGEVITGTNVENRSYGLTVCAERVAVLTAMAAGKRQFERLAVASPNKDFITPCGACLQVLSEFCADLKVILVGANGEIKKTSLRRLYPKPFVLKK